MNSESTLPVCDVCSRQNRSGARFCRFCGARLAIALEIDPKPRSKVESVQKVAEPATVIPSPPATAAVKTASLDDLVGRTQLKQKLSAIINKVKLQQERLGRGLPAVPLNLHALFTGSTGTGKTLTARLLAKSLHSLGLIPADSLVELSMEQLERYKGPVSALLQAEASKAGGGIVIIDEIHKNTRLIGEIVNFLERMPSGKPGSVIFILTGLHEPVDQYFQKDSDDLQRFGLIHHFQDYSAADLGAIARAYLERHSFSINPTALPALDDFTAACLRANETPYRNGWLVEREIVPRILNAQSDRLATLASDQLGTDTMLAITPADIPSAGLPVENAATILAELDQLVGMDMVKEEIRRLADTVQIRAERLAAQAGTGAAKTSGSGETPVHLVLSGNPGTGKTTIARMLGRLFRAIGLLPTDRVLEVDRGKLVAQYVGQTAPLVHKTCDQAKGGILFIDEAYTLAPAGGGSRDPFGQEALDTLLKRMEDDRGQYVVIAAGYRHEMERFVAANPGLKSRFTTFMHLEDYTPAELAAIYRQMATKAGLILDAEADTRLDQVLNTIWESRGDTFANGREVRNLFESTLKDQSRRLARLPREERTNDALRTITAADIPGDAGQALHAKTPESEASS